MEILVRATVIFFFLWLLTRALGKRELAEMNAFELLILVTVGDLVQQGVTQEDYSVTGAMLAVGTMAFWALVFSFISFRFPKMRDAIEGMAVVVIRDGRLEPEVLKLERVTLDELKEAARSQGIDDLADVRLGVLEPDGRFSFLTDDAGQHEPAEKHKG